MTPEIENRIKAVQAGRVPAGYKRTAGGIVPNEWEETPLEKCLVEYKEKTTKPNQYPMLTSARAALMLQSDYYSGHQVTTDDNVGYNVLPRGYVTFRSRTDDGRFKFNENNIIDKGIISYFYPVFSFNNHVDHKYMLFLLNETIYRQMFPYNEGTAQMVLSFNKLKSLQYSIPPLSEQKKIAEILATQDRVIELKEKLIAEKQSQKKYLMSVLLGDDFKKPFKLNGVIIDKKKWEKKKIGEVCDNYTGLTYAPEDVSSKGVLVLRSSNIQNGRLCFDDNVYVDMEIPARSKVKIGDILVCVRNGSRSLIGKSAIITKEAENAAFGAFMTVLRSKNVDQLFLFYIWQSNYIQNQIKVLMGALINQITSFDIQHLHFSCPTPPEQKAIADVLSAADEEISLLQKDLEQEKFKKKSLMQLLLTGLVRVQ